MEKWSMQHSYLMSYNQTVKKWRPLFGTLLGNSNPFMLVLHYIWHLTFFLPYILIHVLLVLFSYIMHAHCVSSL